ncbi:AraC family transcriptional regulator [Marinobacter confluentis]|nr:AraC family transcriptional regulator [Marinobacter confluentis]
MAVGSAASTAASDCIGSKVNKRWHCHDELELHYFRRIRGKAFIGDYEKELDDENLFLVGPNVPHYWLTESPEGSRQEGFHCSLFFSDFNLVNSFQVLTEFGKLQLLLEDAKLGIEFKEPSVISGVGESMMDLQKMEGCAVVGGLFSVLDCLLEGKRQTLNSDDFIACNNNFESRSIERAIYYINNNFHEFITLDKAAAIANMSSAHFCRIFKRIHGVGFVDYLNKLRVEFACQLLAHLRKSVSSIAYECGYVSLSSFNRNFQKYMNQSPSEYRRQRVLMAASGTTDRQLPGRPSAGV